MDGFNIPAGTAGLPEGEPATVNLPDGSVQAKSSRGAVGYMRLGRRPVHITTTYLSYTGSIQNWMSVRTPRGRMC